MTGVPNLSHTIYPFSTSTDEHVSTPKISYDKKAECNNNKDPLNFN